MRRFFSLIMTLAMVGALMTGCSKRKAGDVASIKASGVLTVFTNPTFPPYEFLGENGQIIGVDMDIAQKIADKLGVKLEAKNAEFDGIIAAIASGKADMGISGFTITDERKTRINFSVPYVDSVQYMILPEASAITCLEELAGKAIGTQQGTTGSLLVEDEVAKGVLKDTKSEVKPYNNAPDAVVNLKEGRVAAVVIDELVAQNLAKNNPGYKAVPLVFKNGKPVTEQFGIAIAKGNDELLKIADEVINTMKADGSLALSFKKNEEIASRLEKK